MAFTPIAIEGQFFDGDGSPAVGTVCITPSFTLFNDGVEQTCEPICGVLDSEGRIAGQDLRALVVNASDDTGTTPADTSYTFSLKLDGEDLIEFTSPVPHNPSSWTGIIPATCTDGWATGSVTSMIVDLTDLLAADAMIGATLSGLNNGTVVSVDEEANTLTASIDSSYTGMHSLGIAGGCVSFVALQENAL